ncbi:two-component sensor histidine kinase LytT [Neobacillus bataviensis LMG 21833]|uniref:histidine kinase n=1 Tax=Neobacillus bataviensis LMG 21833 TaxID=1117379 RepID=K6C6B2_9BACI|nr:sensor histidine kinase [Neobacillus bataviensis]EKN66665.1 two-component sensor histidine kinase LytT [Neobacillus bataviensis LMG 21833]
MFNLAPLMLEKVGIIVIVAFLLSKMRTFRQVIQTEHSTKEKIMLILLFGAFGIISNYTGIEVHHHTVGRPDWLTEMNQESALANTRVMGIVIGGLLGGPTVGIGAGLIAGIHRYTLGGFTAFSCALSTILAGMAAGYFGKRRKQNGKQISSAFAVIIGMALEAVQMLIILVAAKPFHDAWELVQLIGLPMIFGNGLGTMLFMFIIQTIKRDEVRARANQTNQAFLIADQTLPFFRQGLNFQSCKEISGIILGLTDADAVAITDDHQVLAHVGTGADHHIPKSKPETGLTRKVLENGLIAIARSKEEISCFHHQCSLEAAIVLPLKVKNKIFGTLKMYYTEPEKLDKVQRELAEGLANLFSTQLELVAAERQTKLLKDAEIKALQAQIHPHFLFNSINTISALCRTDADKARKLLLELSSFFRGNLQGARQMLIPLEKELANVKAYLSLEQTRFPNKYKIVFQIEPDLGKVLIPPFTLQPLVENAIHYGFPRSKSEGRIEITIFSKDNQLQIIVADDGKGIPEDRLEVLGKQVVHSKKGNGTAIFNITERLKGIYNGQASLSLKSKVDLGTTIIISLPFDSKGGLNQHVESIYSG